MAAFFTWLLTYLAAKLPISSPETWLWLVRAVGCGWFVLMVIFHRANFGCHVLGACLWIDAASHAVLAMRGAAK